MRRVIDGLVLRELQSGENDKMILVLTADEGKLWICAKGGRSLKSKTASLCRPFVYANLEIYDKNSRYWLSGGDIRNCFFALGADIEEYALAAYISEIASEITGEGEALGARDALRATLNAYYAIENKKASVPLIKAAYELFAASVSGFTPNLYECEDCGKATEGNVWLDVMNGSLLCPACLSERGAQGYIPELDIYATKSILLPLNTSALRAMQYCVSADLSRLFAFSLTDEESMAQFSRACESYLLNHLERDFDTLNFYNSIRS